MNNKLKSTIGGFVIILGILFPWIAEPLHIGIFCGILLTISGINLIKNG